MPSQQVQHQFNVGDPVLYEFKRVFVEQVNEGGRVLSVRNDIGSWGGCGEGEVFPVTDEGLGLVEFFSGQYDNLRELDAKARVLNWPDIAAYMQREFVRVMTLAENRDLLGMVKAVREMNDWCLAVANTHWQVTTIPVNGVFVIGQH